MSTKELKPHLLLITYAGAVFLAVTHLDRILNQISWITSVIMPFTIALVIAFVLNRPYKLIHHRVYTPLLQKAGLSEKKVGSISGVLSILSVYFLLFFIVGKLVSSVIPELIVSIETFSSNMDDYLSDMTALISRISTQLQLNSEIARLLNTYWQDLLAGIYQTLNTLLPALVDFSMGAATSIYNVFSGLIISIYLLTGKDKLIRTFKKMLYAFLPDRWADYIMHVGHVANRSFGGFLTGQIIDSAIVGLLCFLGMSVMNMPYAMLSSVIVGVTNIIPYFGPIIGAIPGVVLLLLSNPIKAVLFIILIVCIQQLDGNIMAPRIVGSSIGVSGVWVLFSIIVGGSLFGVPGMVAGLPTFSVIYVLVREQAHRRLLAKNRQINNPEEHLCEGDSCVLDDSVTEIFGKEPEQPQ
ncbi:MAG TPA: AI-2E family transporter [Firmicutes bacterium]|nr:AI-2E family transporter [Bacillota bacterium]